MTADNTDRVVQGWPDYLKKWADATNNTTLTPELADALPAIPSCQHCGGKHSRACPRVKRLAFHPSGTIAEVEFWEEGTWSDRYVLWPDVPEDTAAEPTEGG